MSASAEHAAEELQATLASITTKDLVNELAKRDKVELIPVPEDRKWYLTVTDEDGYGDEAGKGYGPLNILVVKD